MSETYSAIGQALYTFMGSISIDPLTWKVKLNRPPKSNELVSYPSYVVVPARDGQETGDTDTDFDSVTYSVFIILSSELADDSESKIRTIVDSVRSKFRELRHDPTPLHRSAYNVSFVGEWGGEAEQGERWYRLDITVFVHEILIPDTP